MENPLICMSLRIWGTYSVALSCSLHLVVNQQPDQQAHRSLHNGRSDGRNLLKFSSLHCQMETISKARQCDFQTASCGIAWAA